MHGRHNSTVTGKHLVYTCQSCDLAADFSFLVPLLRSLQIFWVTIANKYYFFFNSSNKLRSNFYSGCCRPKLGEHSRSQLLFLTEEHKWVCVIQYFTSCQLHLKNSREWCILNRWWYRKMNYFWAFCMLFV